MLKVEKSEYLPLTINSKVSHAGQAKLITVKSQMILPARRPSDFALRATTDRLGDCARHSLAHGEPVEPRLGARLLKLFSLGRDLISRSNRTFVFFAAGNRIFNIA